MQGRKPTDLQWLHRIGKHRPTIGRLCRSGPFLGVFDQALSSGNNFLTVILIGKLSGAVTLGTYTLAFSAMILFQVIADALVAWPYTIRRLEPEVHPQRFAGSTLVHLGLLAALIGVGALLAALGIAAFAPTQGGIMTGDIEKGDVARTFAAMAALVPAFLFRHVARRFEFAFENYQGAIRIDGAVLLAQVSGVLWLGSAGYLTSTVTLLWIAAVNALVCAAWYFANAHRFALSSDILSDWRRNFALGRWMVAGEVIGVIAADFIFWLLAASQGVQATGIFSACFMVVLILNPLMLGVQSVLQPRCAKIFLEQNLAALRREIARATALLGWMVGIYFIVISLAGGWIVATLYGGEEYSGHHTVVVLLAAQAVATVSAMAAGCGLNAMQRTDAVFWAGLVRVGFSVVLAFPLSFTFGLTGAAAALLVGAIAGAALRIWAFAIYSAPQSEAVYGALPANSEGV